MYRRDAIRFQGLDTILRGWTGYVAQIASIACGYEISPVGFTRRSRVYQCDAIRFQGFVEIKRTSLILDYY